MNGSIQATGLARQAHHLGHLARREGLPQSAGLDVQNGWRNDRALGGRLVASSGAWFKAKTTYSSVNGANLLDWPISLSDLAPYYAKAEDKMGVTRTNDIPGLPGNNNFKVMYNGATRVGYKTVHTGRMAINSRPRDRRSSCWQLGFCFQGCKSGAKWSTLYTEIPKAEATGKLDLRPESHALQIQHDAHGKATGVLYADKDGKHVVRRRAWYAWPAIQSKARGSCSTPPRPPFRTAWPIHPARSAGATCGIRPARSTQFLTNRCTCIAVP